MYIALIVQTLYGQQIKCMYCKLRLLNKNKPIQYIYILEYPNGDVTTRKRLRNRLKVELPFVLQDSIENGKRLIERLDVLSIDEWNADSVYGNYPMKRISG